MLGQWMGERERRSMTDLGLILTDVGGHIRRGLCTYKKCLGQFHYMEIYSMIVAGDLSFTLFENVGSLIMIHFMASCRNQLEVVRCLAGLLQSYISAFRYLHLQYRFILSVPIPSSGNWANPLIVET